MLPWTFNDKKFTEENLENYVGFCYLITNLVTGQKYIGKKFFYSSNRIKVKGKTRRRVVKKQSNWKVYTGSSKYLQKQIEDLGEDNFKREILSLHESKADVNLAEIKLQIAFNVLNSLDETGERAYYNENIGLRFYPKKPRFKDQYSHTVLGKSYELFSN